MVLCHDALSGFAASLSRRILLLNRGVVTNCWMSSALSTSSSTFNNPASLRHCLRPVRGTSKPISAQLERGVAGVLLWEAQAPRAYVRLDVVSLYLQLLV